MLCLVGARGAVIRASHLPLITNCKTALAVDVTAMSLASLSIPFSSIHKRSRLQLGLARDLHPHAGFNTIRGPSTMHHRPLPTVRSSSSLSSHMPRSKPPSPRMTPLLPSPAMTYPKVVLPTVDTLHRDDEAPTICGMPLKYVSLVTLAVQNAALSIVMHYSRVSTPPALSYSPASAVLLNELLKGGISFLIALARVPQVAERPWHRMSFWTIVRELPYPWTSPFWWLCGEVLSPDCWKLSIPAILYVVQNSLQFVAISNLPVASFQVTYQMKILTTAAFSVALLRRKLSPIKWLSLFFLAIGVGIVQIQTSTIGHAPKNVAVGSAHDSAPLHIHVMSPLKGFGAVTAACFTSGLAGVYFEMVLKNSRADLWVRNVQLSLFSLIPALLPVLYSSPSSHHSRGFFLDVFRNFGGWAWATVAVQVFGGLVTAVVIKYSDNILKGFATSLSIILSFLASVALFHFRITPSFIIGATTVLCATWMYNQPPGQEPLAIVTLTTSASGRSTPFPGTPVDSTDPILGQFPVRKGSSPRLFGVSSTTDLHAGLGVTPGHSPWGSVRSSPYASPYPSRPASPHPPPQRSPPRTPMLNSDSGSGDGA
ncbi:UDP-galactose transporter [Mycena venus]|uniref:UDP-galactose transporter n=1 Tax=Mycena venus TaxID=2733690 RepID=A0A8H6XBB9_9AGAR|nr:UDP-galactose transporter [Mycena venus]